ncbi:hypothetical protein [Streptomyces nojiriensis]|uniref:hypothetical protein n=1 Tax=Streptomyces nojiriensis TaxID=66374 RepID=UPI00365B891D
MTSPISSGTASTPAVRSRPTGPDIALPVAARLSRPAQPHDTRTQPPPGAREPGVPGGAGTAERLLIGGWRRGVVRAAPLGQRGEELLVVAQVREPGVGCPTVRIGQTG